MTRPYEAEGAEGDRRHAPELLGGRYEILELLGRGGMAEVFRARDHALHRLVAVKLLPLERRGDDTDAGRLQNEARAAAGLSHPHVVAVHDVGVSPGGVFVVMELLDGRTWRDDVTDRGPSAERDAAHVGAQVASALAAAHARGVLHRDVKPANVMLLDDGAAKLMDFGIARVEHVTGLTETGRVVGTPEYMAPEQVRDEPLDGRCDVYALGCALYEAVTGRPPFRGVGAADVAAARLREPPVPPRQVRPDLSTGIEDVIMRAMALAPAARPDAARLAEELRGLGDGRVGGERAAVPTMRTPVPDEELATATLPGGGPPSPETPAPGTGLRRAGAVLVTLGVLAVIAVALWLSLG